MQVIGNRLNENQIVAGVPLAMDAFDADGKLLLRKGYVIESDAQKARLIERGLYVDELPHHRYAALQPQSRLPHYRTHKVSVFDLLNDVRCMLEAQLAAPLPADFAANIKVIGQLLQRACALDPDAAVATIQLQSTGRYAVRRMVQNALVTELLLVQLGEPASVRLPAVCAALTSNIAVLALLDTLYLQRERPSPEQRAVLEAHPRAGADILQRLGVQEPKWLDLVSQHHELPDGSGYPARASGEAVNRSTQVMGLADQYAAMATGRAYRPALLPNVALKEIFQKQGRSVSPELVAHLVKAVSIYPPGSLVALANGELAIVAKRTQRANQPVVRTVRTDSGRQLEVPRKRVTSDPIFAVQRLLPMSALGFAVDPATVWNDAFEFDTDAPVAA